jgi:hypothetical protein
MKYLERLRAHDKKVFVGDTAPSKLTEPNPITEVATTELTKPSSVGFAGADPHVKLSTVSEAARRDVLAWLEKHPSAKRAFATRVEGDVLIVTLALRDVGTCELSVPLSRFNPERLTDWGALLSCLDPDDSLGNSERALNG